ncbi:MAG TPA: beta-galactosidase small subunit, partial [Phnomibacter sp.]|nr:beta-galactosidase small subunit [Phnomibacter sp.]
SLQYEENASTISFITGDIRGTFNKSNGNWMNYTKGGDRIFNQMPQPYFWRAPIDNDFGNRMPDQLGIWRNAHVNRKVTSSTITHKSADSLVLEVAFMLNGIHAPYSVRYHVNAAGEVTITASIDLTGRELPEMPRFGMRMELGKEYEQLAWYGRGPFENYSDRKTAAFLGEYTSTVTDEYVPYIRPQEHGYKTDTRWVQLNNGKNVVRIDAIGQPVCFSTLHYTTEDLDAGMTKKQQRISDLVPRPMTMLHVDHAQRGVGGDNSWGALPHEPYRLNKKQYSYAYKISVR